jgi:peptidoglycan/LPS O-acetylase OafA/YrhL
VTPSAPASHRSPGIDFVLPPGAFRLLLAAAVLVSHLSSFDIGRLAVVLFFYLSGYWTALIWRQKFGGSAVLHFYAARYFRVWPLFFLVTVAAALARSLPLHVENWTLFGLGSTHRDPTGVSWSLDVEVQFYLLLPLVAAAVSRMSLSASILTALVIGALGCWLAHAFGLLTVAKYLPAFVLGSLTYQKAWTPERGAARISLLAFAGATLLTAFTPFLRKVGSQPFDDDIYAFFWMLPLLPYVAHSLTRRSSSLDRHLGNLSFPLYLVHVPLIAVMRANFGDTESIKAAGTAAACATALLLYILVDRPIDRLRVLLTERPLSGAKDGAGG